jgi:hypothetical protein
MVHLYRCALELERTSKLLGLNPEDEDWVELAPTPKVAPPSAPGIIVRHSFARQFWVTHFGTVMDVWWGDFKK